MVWLAVGVGGALGSAMRHGVNVFFGHVIGRPGPYATATVNIIGSLFYGGLLGVFVLAFCFKSVGATGAFCGVLAGEAAIFAANLFTKISFLWYNVIGCLVVVVVGVIVSRIVDRERKLEVVAP